MDGPAALTFARLRAVNVERCKRWHPGFPTEADWTGEDWSNAVAGEMGEACNVVKKLRRQETGARGAVDPDSAVLVARLGEEIADTLIYLDLLEAFYGLEPPIYALDDVFRGRQVSDVGGARLSNACAVAMGKVCEAVMGHRGGLFRLLDATSLLRSRLGALAAFYGVDVSAAVVAKFDAISAREGWPDRLGAA